MGGVHQNARHAFNLDNRAGVVERSGFKDQGDGIDVILKEVDDLLGVGRF